MEEANTMVVFNFNFPNRANITEEIILSLYRSNISDYNDCISYITELPYRAYLFLGRYLSPTNYTLRIVNCSMCDIWYGFPYKRFCFCDNCKQYICMECISSSNTHLYHVKIFDYIIMLKEMSYEYNSAIYKIKRQ